MKKWWAGSLLLLSFGFNLSFSGADEAVGPRMLIRKNSFHAREVDEGKAISHTFTVLNTGDQTLYIRKVKPG